MVASEEGSVLRRRIAEVTATMAVHFVLALTSTVLGHLTRLGVWLLDGDLLLPLAIAKNLREIFISSLDTANHQPQIATTDLFNELLLGTVADHSLHFISRQLRAQYSLYAHCGMWTVDDKIAASVEFGT